jgi:glucose/arabinose dehydrogenase
MRINEKFEVLESVRVEMNERIRDLEVLSNGSLITTTDSGQLITVTNSKQS